jgi:N-acylneuraminate cytidylyltransferase
MIDSRSVVAMIPARGGSKGVPRKNVRPAGGKPLIAWSIAAAHASRYLDRVILSTDDDEIAAVAGAWGCEVPFMRPAALASDEASSVDVVRHAVQALPVRYDYLVLLQPTSPLRLAQDIDAALELCVRSAAPACVSVCEPDKSPYWMMTLAGDATIAPLFGPDQIPARRQDAPAVFALNGAVYVATVDHLASGGDFLTAGTKGYVMPKDRSLDVDTEFDLWLVDRLLSERQR